MALMDSSDRYDTWAFVIISTVLRKLTVKSFILTVLCCSFLPFQQDFRTFYVLYLLISQIASTVPIQKITCDYSPFRMTKKDFEILFLFIENWPICWPEFHWLSILGQNVRVLRAYTFLILYSMLISFTHSLEQYLYSIQNEPNLQKTKRRKWSSYINGMVIKDNLTLLSLKYIPWLRQVRPRLLVSY